eukprot:scaffold80774_cov72-Phaeocystis_antarctica.AAC.1
MYTIVFKRIQIWRSGPSGVLPLSGLSKVVPRGRGARDGQLMPQQLKTKVGSRARVCRPTPEQASIACPKAAQRGEPNRTYQHVRTGLRQPLAAPHCTGLHWPFEVLRAFPLVQEGGGGRVTCQRTSCW